MGTKINNRRWKDMKIHCRKYKAGQSIHHEVINGTPICLKLHTDSKQSSGSIQGPNNLHIIVKSVDIINVILIEEKERKKKRQSERTSSLCHFTPCLICTHNWLQITDYLLVVMSSTLQEFFLSLLFPQNIYLQLSFQILFSVSAQSQYDPWTVNPLPSSEQRTK